MEDTFDLIINQPEPEPELFDAEEAAFVAGESYIYAISCPELSVVKIGVSRSPDRRLATLQSCFPCDLHHEAVWLGSYEEEQQIHQKLSVYRKRSEWFRMAPSDIIRTITTILNREPVWQPDRFFKKQQVEESVVPTHPAHIQLFIDKYIAFAPDAKIQVKVIYGQYLKWCRGRGGNCLKRSQFTRTFTDQGVRKEKTNGQIYFFGVTFRRGPA